MKKLNVTKNAYRRVMSKVAGGSNLKGNKRTRAALMDSLCSDAAQRLNLGISRWCAKHSIENL